MKLIPALTLSLLVSTVGLAAADDAKCPVSGKPVDPSVASNVNGKSVGFCCEKCQAKHEEALNVKDAGPGECPISGEKAVAGTRLLLSKTEAVYFCCGKCQKKYGEEHKVAAIQDDGPGKCLYSGEKADPDAFVVHNGKKVYFCCEDCVAKYRKENNVLLSDAGPVKCAVSGEPADGDYVSYVITTTATYFCCEKCQAKFVAKEVAAKL